MKNQRTLIISVFIVASCGLAYELIIAALASYLLGDSILQFSSIIGLYLFSMGIGAHLTRYIKDEDALTRFIEIELLVGIIGGLSGHTDIGDGKTLLNGAQILGKSIEGNTRDLEIHSPQGTMDYQSRQNALSGNVLYGYGVSVNLDYQNTRVDAHEKTVNIDSGQRDAGHDSLDDHARKTGLAFMAAVLPRKRCLIHGHAG